MSHPHQITDPVRALEFALAGDARFTIVSVKTGTRYTFRISLPRNKETGAVDRAADIKFVGVLTGESNESNFSYMGFIGRDNTFVPPRPGKSRISMDAPSAKAFAFFWSYLIRGQLHAGIELWHEGKCGRCGRTLTVPESIETGFGPECIGKIGLFADMKGMVAPETYAGHATLPQPFAKA